MSEGLGVFMADGPLRLRERPSYLRSYHGSGPFAPLFAPKIGPVAAQSIASCEMGPIIITVKTVDESQRRGERIMPALSDASVG